MITRRRGRGLTAGALVAAAWWVPAGAAQGTHGISAEVFAGTAWSLRTPLSLRQQGETPIHIPRARYTTRPWTGAPYYAYRFGYASGNGAWEAELVHHKLYLEDPPPEVAHFEVSHGYNLVTLNRATGLGSGTRVRVGVGLVVGHPEGRVRSRAVGPVRSALGGGYQVGGATAQVAIGQRFGVGGNWWVTPEAKLTTSYARFPLGDNGWARVPNTALHLLAGLGHEW